MIHHQQQSIGIQHNSLAGTQLFITHIFFFFWWCPFLYFKQLTELDYYYVNLLIAIKEQFVLFSFEEELNCCKTSCPIRSGRQLPDLYSLTNQSFKVLPPPYETHLKETSISRCNRARNGRIIKSPGITLNHHQCPTTGAQVQGKTWSRKTIHLSKPSNRYVTLVQTHWQPPTTTPESSLLLRCCVVANKIGKLCAYMECQPE